MTDAAALRWDGTTGQFLLPCLLSLPLKTSSVQDDCLALLQPALSCFTLQGYLVPVAPRKSGVNQSCHKSVNPSATTEEEQGHLLLGELQLI